jgi:hypothetical protein
MNKNVKKIMFSTIFSLVIVISSFNYGIASKIKTENTEYYGFILPLFECENETFENQINCRIRHLVNDLLREQIPVYWASTNFTAVVSTINFENESEMDFEKGSFIIPFTGDDYNDTKILVIIYDYNQTSEIENDSQIGIPVYLIMESLEVFVFPLNEVKIAQCTTTSSTGLSYYIEKAGKCGFLSYNLLYEKNINKLNNTAYNLIVWPGGTPGSWLKLVLDEIVRDLKYKISNNVRCFVSNGGGFVGSCYGAYISSSGVLPVPVYFIRRAHNPNLKSIGLLAISDILTTPVLRPLGLINSIIVNDNHPVTYGLGNGVKDLHLYGPKIVHTGKNTNVLARFKNSNFRLENTPVWVTSEFGEGKIVLFSSHPEMMDNDDHSEFLELDEGIGDGKKIISNSFFYATSEDLEEVQLMHYRNLSFIDNICTVTSDLSDDNDEVNVFNDIKNSINETKQIFLNLSDDVEYMIDLIFQIADQKKIDLNISYYYLGAIAAFYYKYDLELFIEYVNSAEETLDEIEEMYPLMESNPVFIQEINNLKDDISHRINKSKTISLKSKSLSKEIIDDLLEFRNLFIFTSLAEKNIEEKMKELYHNNEKCFNYLPQAYFDSLRFLRCNWYNYETHIASQ